MLSPVIVPLNITISQIDEVTFNINCSGELPKEVVGMTAKISGRLSLTGAIEKLDISMDLQLGDPSVQRTYICKVSDVEVSKA